MLFFSYRLQTIFQKKYSDLFIGPDTDKLNKALHRPDGVHFSHIGLDAHADGWGKAIKKVR